MSTNSELHLDELDLVTGGDKGQIPAGLSASCSGSTTVDTTNRRLDGGNAGGLFLVTLIGSYFHN